MTPWPEVDGERQRDALLRADLYESRYLSVGELNNAVNLLLRAAASACLLDREADALALATRASLRTSEWVAAVKAGKMRPGTFTDFGATRGLLALALTGPEDVATSTATTFLAVTADAPPGPVQNARLAAAALVNDNVALQAAAKACELSDAGLGLPWRRFATALEAKDATALARHALAWLREKEEATRTSEWGDYDDVPIEVSGALALAERYGVEVRLASNRVLTRFRG